MCGQKRSISLLLRPNLIWVIMFLLPQSPLKSLIIHVTSLLNLFTVVCALWSGHYHLPLRWLHFSRRGHASSITKVPNRNNSSLEIQDANLPGSTCERCGKSSEGQVIVSSSNVSPLFLISPQVWFNKHFRRMEVHFEKSKAFYIALFFL